MCASQKVQTLVLATNGNVLTKLFVLPKVQRILFIFLLLTCHILLRIFIYIFWDKEEYLFTYLRYFLTTFYQLIIPWMRAICWAKMESQFAHLNGLNWWIFLQNSHLNFFCPSWPDTMCPWRQLSWALKVRKSQNYFFK